MKVSILEDQLVRALPRCLLALVYEYAISCRDYVHRLPLMIPAFVWQEMVRATLVRSRIDPDDMSDIRRHSFTIIHSFLRHSSTLPLCWVFREAEAEKVVALCYPSSGTYAIGVHSFYK